MNNVIRRLAAPVAMVVGVGAAATALEVARDPIPDLGAQAPQLAVAGPADLSTAFRAASRAALPAVVHVKVESAPRTVGHQVPSELRGTPFEQYFRGPQGPQPRGMGSGSGFIVSTDGYIVTNNHVVENASRVTVVLTDKREFEARVVGRDPNTDVAVLKVEAKGLPTARMGAATGLDVGDWVLALGYPLSLGETVTAGIVSAKGKSINILRQNAAADAPLEHFIQTDAAINPGNSGGPLVDLHGRVVGVNTAIASPTGAYAGYGFAVPIELAKRVADDLIRHGAVQRPKLGVQINDVTPADVEVFRLESARGSVVVGVPAGPAKDAGMELGDVIVAVDGAPIKDTGDLMERVALRHPGETVTLDVVRYGKAQRLRVKLGTFQTEPVPATVAAESDSEGTARLGFAAREIDARAAAALKLPQGTRGVVVTSVDPMGPAPQGLVGMRLETVNGKRVSSVADLRAAASGLRGGGTVSVVGTLPDGTRTIVNYRVRG